MRFDRWSYDLEKNRFVHRPVTAVISTVQEHAYAAALLQAHLDKYVRLIDGITKAYENRLWEMQRKIDDLRDR